MGIKRIAQWAVIFGTLGIFTLWVGAAYAAPSEQILETDLSDLDSSSLVYFEDQNSRTSVSEYVCSISASQLKQLQQNFKVSFAKLSINGRSTTVVTVVVNDKNSVATIKQIVGSTNANQCHIQIFNSILYFFTVPSLS
jgi:hypothetical protein